MPSHRQPQATSILHSPSRQLTTTSTQLCPHTYLLTSWATGGTQQATSPVINTQHLSVPINDTTMGCCGQPMGIPTPGDGGGGRPYAVHKPRHPYGPKQDNRRRFRLPGGYNVTLEGLFYTYLVIFAIGFFYKTFFPFGWEMGWKGRVMNEQY